MTVDPALVQARVDSLRARLATSGRLIEVVAVTKGFGAEAVEAAHRAGCRRIGENYAQELLAKLPQASVDDLAVHFIGRLQSNKVRMLAPAVHVWESVDRPSLLVEIARRSPGATVLVQVNATSEAGKGGCDPEQAGELVARGRELGLDVDGLMTVGPTSGEPGPTATAFGRVRDLVDELSLRTCSMGMTHDLDIAVAAGTTRVRLGTAIFGPRQ